VEGQLSGPVATGGRRPVADVRHTGQDERMTVEQADIIDGVGLRKDGSAVEMRIYDHLEWNGPEHLRVLAAKLEAYANAVLDGQLAQSFPTAEGREVCISVVYQHKPNADAKRFFDTVEQQLASAGIGFTHMTLPRQY
jgi:hypothetical protein